MSDALHSVLKQVRDSYLDGLSQTIHSLFANLESKIRDVQVETRASGDFVTKKEFNELKERIDTQIVPVLNRIVPDLNAITPILVDWKTNMAELKGMFDSLQKSVASSANVVVSKPAGVVVDLVEETSTEATPVAEEEEEEELAPKDDDSAEPSFTAMEVDGKTYWLDDDHIVYKETEEGYEQIGSYDPETGELEVEDEEEPEEEEGDSEELESFEYKGKTYYRDSENIVYNEEVEEVGIWTGSKIVVKKS